MSTLVMAEEFVVKDGLHPEIERAQYDAIDAINISTLCHGPTMLHLKHAKDNPEEPTDALVIGTAVHLAVYEPSEFEKRVVQFEGRRAGSEWKEFEVQHHESLILKTDSYDKVLGIRDAVRRSKAAKEILDAPGRGEVCAIWRDETTGLRCKGMIDRIGEWHGYTLISDLKTTTDASARAFQRTVMDYQYHVKAAWYLDACNILAPHDRRFAWIVVEKEAPHAVALYEPSDAMLRKGSELYRKLLDRYAQCLKTNEWPGFPEGVEPIELPAWAGGVNE